MERTQSCDFNVDLYTYKNVDKIRPFIVLCSSYRYIFKRYKEKLVFVLTDDYTRVIFERSLCKTVTICSANEIVHEEYARPTVM